MKDLYTMNEQLVEKFKKGLVNEDTLRASVDSDFFPEEHREIKKPVESEEDVVARKIHQPPSYSID